MTNQYQDVVEKVRKLLALSTSGNEHEAALAMERAQGLALKHQLDLAAIEVFEKKPSDEPIEKGEPIEVNKRQGVCQKFVNWIIQNHFNTRIITSRRWNGNFRVYIGRKTDISMAIYVNDFLNETFMRLWREYKARTGAETRERESFIYGLYSGLDSKLEANKQQSQNSAIAEIKRDKGEQAANQCAMILLSHKEKLEEKVRELYPNLRTVRKSINAWRGDAISAGTKIGATINISRPLSSGTQRNLTN